MTAVDTILLKVASRCNINCTYCYVYNMGDSAWKRMPPEPEHIGDREAPMTMRPKLQSTTNEASTDSKTNMTTRVDLATTASPTLSRLIEEVRNERDLAPRAYNRSHNRHNRSR